MAKDPGTIPFELEPHSDLISVQDLQEGLVDVRLTLEAVLDLIDIVDRMVELHRLVILHVGLCRRGTG